MGVLRRARDRRSEVGTTQMLREAVQRAVETPVGGVCSRLFRLRHGTGADVMAEDWDTLVLLDACRYDMFGEENTLDGELESRISRGRMSWEFMQANFVGRELHDTVYVTANPYVVNLNHGVFHAVVDEPLTERWDDGTETVPPEDVTDVAIEAHERYPNKRVIVHYMQPHVPYIGETGCQLSQRVSTRGIPRYRSVDGNNGDDEPADGTVWRAVRDGTVDIEEVKEAYRENIILALNEVERLLLSIDGRTVVSSDHGEMFGERPCGLTSKQYGHGKMTWNASLCKVPWLIISGDRRREIVADKPTSSVRLDDERAKQQLEALGYRT